MDAFPPAGLAAKSSPRHGGHFWGRFGGRFGTRITVAILVAGFIFRIVQWAWGQPFWTDEASLLLNIASKTARQLMGSLDLGQACPPLHLLLLRFCFVTSGDSEHSLRLVPLMLSLITLPLFVALAWRILPWVEAVLVAALFAFSDRILWHSAEAKQYTGDLFSVTVLLWISLGMRRPASAGVRLLLLAVVAAVLVWLSHATAFAFGAISLAMAPTVFKERSGKRRWLAGNMIFGVSISLLYCLSIRTQRTAFLTETWRDQFVPWQHPLSIPVWLIRGIIGLCDYPVQGLGVLLLILFLAGLIDLFRRRHLQIFTMMILPIVLLLIASGLRLFPFSGNRVTFFTTPMLLLTAGYGASLIHKNVRGNVRYLGRAMLGIMVIETFALAVFHVWKPEPRTHILPAIAYLKSNYRADEGIYVIGKGTSSMFKWYWRGEPGSLVICKPEFGENVPLPWKRFWVVGIFQPKHGISEMQKDIDYAARGTVEIQRYQGNGSAAILLTR